MKFIALALIALCPSANAFAQVVLTPVAPVDLTNYTSSDFSDEEWYMPYYLKHFSALANAVVAEGPNRGFIDISVWRPQNVNEPYNARIMENIVSLAWFYTQERSWNPYRGDPNLRLRLEAALDFWTRLQREDGRFAEYSPTRFTLAPTAFATKFLGRALLLLKDDKAFDQVLYKRSLSSLRKAIMDCLQSDDLWQHGINYTNQYANVWGGTLMYLEIDDDSALRTLYRARLQQSMTEFQSEAGFFYEAGGPDWTYNLSTHHSDLLVAWHFAKEGPDADLILEKLERWYSWFAINAVLEPQTKRYYLNRAVETRTSLATFENSEVVDPATQRWVPQSEFVETARAFELSQEELLSSQARKHQEMAALYPEVPPLVVGTFWAYSPYAFVHEGMAGWFPTQAEKDAATRQLPYLADQHFAQLRYDARSQTHYAFIRKPSYYAIVNSGRIVTDKQRFGLGLLWNPKIGTVMQSQSNSDLAAYGTRQAGQVQVFEAGDVLAEYQSANNSISGQQATETLDVGPLTITYPLGKLGQKVINIAEASIRVSIDCQGAFEEIIPLLLGPDDTLSVDSGTAILTTKQGRFEIVYSGSSSLATEAVETGHEYKRCIVVKASATGSLQYEMRFAE